MLQPILNGFLAFAALLAVVGVLSLSQATRGVGFIGVACLLAIVARIAQATEMEQWQEPLPRPKVTTGVAVLMGLLVVLVLVVAVLSAL